MLNFTEKRNRFSLSDVNDGAQPYKVDSGASKICLDLSQRIGDSSDEINKVLDLIVEIAKLKQQHRKIRLVGLGQDKNFAEHSGHICLAALMSG